MTTETGNPNNPHDELIKQGNGNLPTKWINENTALLVVHGIGNQMPMETLEQFGRNLIQTYKKHMPEAEFTIEHLVRPKAADEGGREWYDNYIRIKKDDSGYHLDLYEFYWAHYTEGTAEWSDINKWLLGITSGAKKFYRQNIKLSQTLNDRSIVNHPFVYFSFIGIASHILLLVKASSSGFKAILSYIPVFGLLLQRIYDSLFTTAADTVTNVLGDLVAYTVTDAKSKYYPVRRAILDGAVKSILFLMETGKKTFDSTGKLTGLERSYPNILIAGHSLGSVIAYDAINRVNLMINCCEVETYEKNGHCKFLNRSVCDQLKGLITFGSPLDKTAFFLRENIPAEQFVRQQLLNNFMTFKQRNWTPELKLTTGFFEVKNEVSKRLLDNMPWRNYYDHRDYVSGDLDYYQGLTNVHCGFPKRMGSFTHSTYWSYEPFYRDIIYNFLTPTDSVNSAVANEFTKVVQEPAGA